MRLPNTHATAARLCSSRFRPGTYWLWEYRDRTGAFTCAERYQVQAQLNPTTVVVEMASKLEEGDPWNAHHRLTVDLVKPLASAGLDGPWRNAHPVWNLELFSFKDENGKWRPAMHRWNTQAFEEKFDVHSMLPAQPVPIRILRSCQRCVASFGDDPATLIRTQRLRHTNAWYVREPREHMGVAAFKTFGSDEAYTFQLVGFGDGMPTAESADTSGDSSPELPSAFSTTPVPERGSRGGKGDGSWPWRRPSRREALVRAACTAAVCCAPVSWAPPALAWCGGYFPGKLTNEWDEKLIPYENAEAGYTTDLFVRIVDPPRRRAYGSSALEYKARPPLPPVLVVGCPGVNYDYCENLEGLVVSGRRVIEVNTCEAPVDRQSRPWMPSTAESVRPGPLARRRPREAASQLLTVCEALGLELVHVFAHGLGGAAALHLVDLLRTRPVAAADLPMTTKAAAPAASTPKVPTSTSTSTSTAAPTPPTATSANDAAPAAKPPPPGVRLASLTLASPYGALEDLRPFARRRIEYNDDVTPLDFEGSDGGQPVDGEQCVVEATLLTGMAWRDALLRPTAAESQSERLGGEALATRLPPTKTVPTQVLIGGLTDPVEPSWDLTARPDVAVTTYPFCGHLPFLDRRTEYLSGLLAFLDGVDGVETSRSGLTDGRGT